jgi:hypothetical protein
MAWREVRVKFIPKSGKSDYTKAKAYCPISLSSSLLKVMKLVDKHIRDGVLKEHFLHPNQYARQNGKSTETAICNVVTHTESATEEQKMALRAYLNIEGAFDRNSFNVITQAAERHGTVPTICRWISMLESRNSDYNIRINLLRGSTAKGYQQGGVRSP